MLAAKTPSQELMAKSQKLRFLKLLRPIQMTVYRAEAQLSPHFRSSEAAEAGAQTVGHSPQGCRPFRVSPSYRLFLPGCRSAGAAPVRFSLISHRKKAVVNRQNVVLMSDNARVL
jgi:hypothetical protein